MADLQKEFEKFHETIKLKRYQENSKLAEKRERVLRRLSEGIKKLRSEGAEIPPYSVRNQGSYAMGTGIKPLEGDYDLDLALVFDLDKGKYDPVEVKKWVLAALQNHTKEVRMREPCVTVFYQAEGEPLYHVDIAVYAGGNGDGKTYLARGKLNSGAENRRWEEADPEALVKAITGRFADDDDRQFRRVIRYLKRWKDQVWGKEGGKPPGIALTAAAYHWFRPSPCDDAGALLGVVETMLSSFSGAHDAEIGVYRRLELSLPVPPGNDLLGRLTPRQMKALDERLGLLANALKNARADQDASRAADLLSGLLGPDFPVPVSENADEEARRARRRAMAAAVAGTSSRAKPYGGE